MNTAQNKLDPAIIDEFRDVINEHGLIYHIYKNRDGRDQWSVICSAMDWIEVAVTGIDPSKIIMAHSNEASISAMTFVNCIDIMWEGIQQLHRVIVDRNTIPFAGDHTIFQKDASDNNYWKAIRAIFAAHPVNLYDITGKEEKTTEKWFASWSGAFIGYGDISVYLYSNIPGKKAEQRNLEKRKLMEFAISRYNYLNTLKDIIRVRSNEYLEKHRRKSLRIYPTDTPEQIVAYTDYLIGENSLRWDNPYYLEKLSEIRDAFSVSFKGDNNQTALKIYQQALLKGLDRIREAISKLDYELDDEGDFVDAVPPIEYQYACEHIFDENKAGLMSFGISKMQQYFGDIISYDECISRREFIVLTKAGLYLKQENKK